MPPRNPELPEGTDHIINGAMGESGGAGGSGVSGGTGTGFVGSADIDDTGGTRASETGAGRDIRAQLRDGASNLQGQAGEKIRSYAETGKTRATSALDEFTQVVNDAASSIDERLGSEYGEYARRAADAVAGFADTLRNKEVDELFEDGRNLVRKSPGVAIGVAAVVGFTLVRLLKTGMESGRSGDREIEFQPDSSLGGTGIGTSGTTGTGGGTTVGGSTGTSGTSGTTGTTSSGGL